MLQWYDLCCPQTLILTHVTYGLAPWHCDRLCFFCIHILFFCFCMFCGGCWSDRPDQAGRVCVLSGFLSRRLADQKEPRVWRVCSLCGFLWRAFMLPSAGPPSLHHCRSAVGLVERPERPERRNCFCSPPRSSLWLQLVHVTWFPLPACFRE